MSHAPAHQPPAQASTRKRPILAAALVPCVAAGIMLTGSPTASGDVRWIDPPPLEVPSAVVGSSGALPVGQASYPVPSGALVVAPNGSDSNPGSTSQPLATVAEAISRSPVGGTVVLRGGTYHQRFTIRKPVTIQNYPNEAVWFDGSQRVSGFVSDNGTWRKDGWTVQFDNSASFTRGSNAGGFVNPEYPMAAHPDQVWIDGVAQQQVASRSAVEPGTFYVDYSSQRLYLGSDPAGQEVRASTLGRAIEIRAEDVQLRGFGVRRYAPSLPDMGTITVERPNATVENLHLIDTSTTGISILAADVTATRLTVLRNGILGIHANHSDGLRMKNVVSNDNNTERFNQAPSSGGMKVTRARDVTIEQSTLSNNLGPGFWFDESVKTGSISRSVLADNAGHGISLELSDNMTVAGNVIRDNGRFGLKINNTSDVEVWNNTIVRNNRPVNIVQDTRRGSNPSTPGHDPRYPGALSWINGPVNVRNNVLSLSTGNCLLCVEDYSEEFTAEDFEVTTNNNFYQRDASDQPTWLAVWSLGAGNPAVFTQLGDFRQATGQESTSYHLLGSAAADADGRVTAPVREAAQTTATGVPAAIAQLINVEQGTRLLGSLLQ